MFCAVYFVSWKFKMSSILKALKKLEDDRATRRPDELKINSEILRSDDSRHFSSTSMLVISLLLIACGSGATYMYMKRDKAQEISNPKPFASVIKTEQLPPAVVVPSNQKQAAKTTIPKKHQTTIPAKTVPAVTTTKTAKPVDASKPSEQANTSISPKVSPPSVPVKTFPALRVDGIAFQDSSSESVAMINGVPVSSGSLIEGVKVEEIHKNRVGFSYNGEKFEIHLGQSNR
jgi:general secretion pathway protein B